MIIIDWLYNSVTWNYITARTSQPLGWESLQSIGLWCQSCDAVIYHTVTVTVEKKNMQLKT